MVAPLLFVRLTDSDRCAVRSGGGFRRGWGGEEGTWWRRRAHYTSTGTVNEDPAK